MNAKTFDLKVDESVQEFVRSLEKPTISKFTKLTDLLQQFGNNLRMPYSKSLGNSLFELRIRGKQEVRIFYTFHKDKAVLLHGFAKKTQKTPIKEIETAIKKLKMLNSI